jgi:DNA uptake protein ComE-like DNA-binding protein
MKLACPLVIALALAGAAALPQSALAASAQIASHKVLDLNSASEGDLERLQGIGPVMAQKIIHGRPYRSKDELVRRKIIPVSAYGHIRDQVIAHHTA